MKLNIHLISGFLGSGKTTAIRTAAGLLMQEGIPTGVITNDQGIRLVDGGFLAAEGIPSRQVMNGCFCCNFSDLDRQISSLTETNHPEVIFAESVGSCTDIVATVFKPMTRFRPKARITLSVVCDSLLLKMLLLEKRHLFEPEIEYIYRKQIEEASLILLNKTDLLKSGEEESISAALQNAFGKKRILALQATDSRSVAHWLAALHSPGVSAELSADVDYELYATGEAMMGWLDSDIIVQTGQPVAGIAARRLIEKINLRIRAAGYPVGHVKWLIDEREKLRFTAVDGPVVFPSLPAGGNLRLLLNARVQAHPDLLTALVDHCIRETAAEENADISTTTHSAFQPGYPRPEHRMA